MKIDLIYDIHCPNIQATREVLKKTLLQKGFTPYWKEWERNSEKTPESFRRWGSPTLLINGRDILGASPSIANSCRIYQSGGVPSEKEILNAIEHRSQNKTPGVLGFFSLGPGVGAALLAKAACPFCYPALAGLFSSLGLGFLFQGFYFQILAGLFLIVTLFGLGFLAKERRGYMPLALGMLGAIAVILGTRFESDLILYSGVGVLVAASIWNIFPKTDKCSSCDPYATKEGENHS